MGLRLWPHDDRSRQQCASWGGRLRAKALGADFALAGRALAFGVGAGGAAGAQRALDILKLELETAMGQLGIDTFDRINSGVLT